MLYISYIEMYNEHMFIIQLLAFIKKTEYETNNFIDFDISAISNKLSE
jgi:hypothetical protein